MAGRNCLCGGAVDSVTTRGVVRISAQDVEGNHHKHVFPLANFMFAAALNAVRATGFGPEVRRETIHELETAAVGVAMLMGLTSVAKGIISSEATAIQMLGHDPGSSRRDQEDIIVDNIFQLTLISAATQIPLSSFGNAAIGNEGFREVRAAFNEITLSSCRPSPGKAARRARKSSRTSARNSPSPTTP